VEWGWLAGGVVAVVIGATWWLCRDRLYRNVIPGSMRADASRSQRLGRFWLNVVAVGLTLWGLYVIVLAVATG
jgi:hypothetical protein